MAGSVTTPPFVRALVEPSTGRLTREGYTFLVTINAATTAAAAGAVTTAPGSGLAGGGQVSSGVSLSITDNGVTNTMIRQSIGNSVVGRFAGTTGNVSDIQAVDEGDVLTRTSGQLVFARTLDLLSVRTDSFRLDQTPAAGTITPTHTITVSVDGVAYKIPIVAA